MGFIRRLTGKTAADAARDAAATQVDYSQQASALLDPFQGIGQQGLDLAGFLTDPQQQYEFLQSNPLFQASLDNANGVTSRMAAASGRLSAGDTAIDLSNNFLTSAYPLIQDQKNNIGNLLNFGLNTAGNQGNLLTGQGAALAGGIVGAENARGQGYNNIMNLGGQIFGALEGMGGMFGGGGSKSLGALGGGGGASSGASLAKLGSAFSDRRLKANIKYVGEQNGHAIHTWDWNSKAADLGLKGSGKGVIADKVQKTHPEAVREHQGYLTVDYDMIGVAL